MILNNKNLKTFLRSNLYPIVVFITGACVLIVEVVALRALSPYFGNTIFTASSVISVILAALSFGYYYGGKYADKNPSSNIFFKIIMSSGLILLCLHITSYLVLPLITINTSISVGPFLATMILYFLPALLLGTLSPFAVKLHSLNNPDKGIGEITGQMFFFSTFGSITGSLSAGFILIPNFGIDMIFIVTASALVLLGLTPLVIAGIEKKLVKKSIITISFLIFVSTALHHGINKLFVFRKDGTYEKITVTDMKINGRPARLLEQDRTSSGAMYLDTQDPTDNPYDYPMYYSLYKVFNPNVKNALVIGGGPYSIPKALAFELPEAKIIVSEIEPNLFEIAKKYFNVPDTNNIIPVTEDGRRLLARSENKYDFVFSDVYYSLYSIPTHVTTKEFFELAKSRLNEKGIFIANIISNVKSKESDLFRAELKTFICVFPNSYFFAVVSPDSKQTQNVIFVGYNSSEKIDLDSIEILQSNNRIIANLKSKQIDVTKIDLESAILLTDNYAPTDSLGAKMIKESFKNN